MTEVRPFGVKFAEAIDFLRSKLPETSAAHDSLAGPVHAKVFTVAGSTKADLVRDLHKSLTSAIENGTTITAFRKDFDRAVQQYGWEYNGKRGWRTSVIFDNNMRSAHMAGRWSQIQAGKERRPFLQYRTAGDARVRPQHRAWNGIIRPVDDLFWQTHYPPNGWGCRCAVRAYSQGDIESKNLSVSPPIEVKTREVITRDGEIKDRVPVGIDPGWDHNVGQAWLAPEVALGQKLARLPRQLQGIVVDKTITPAFQTVLTDNFKAFREAERGGLTDAPSPQIVGFMDSATLQGLADKVPTLKVESSAIGVFDSKVIAARGPSAALGPQAWPEDWVSSLPENVRNYRAVLWNKATGRLVVVPQGAFNDALPTITIQPAGSTAFGQVGTIEALGTASIDDLRDAAKYEVLVGRLKD